MDTSITIALVIGVLFVFLLPAFLRRIDRTITHGHIDEVPATARACAEVGPRSCLRPADGPRLYAADRAASEFTPPQIVHPAAGAAPELHLSRPVPQLAVIDGAVGSAAGRDRTAAPRDIEPEEAVLPLAVGQSAFLPLTAHHDPMDSPMTSSHTPPTAGASMQQRSNRDLPAHLRARIAEARHTSGTAGGPTPGAGRPVRGASRPAPQGSHRGPRPAGEARAHGTAEPAAPSVGPEAEERIARLRSALPFVGLGFLVTALAALVTGILVPFGVLPWAVPVLALVLAVGSLAMVRSINLTIRRLRRDGLASPEVRSAADEYAAGAGDPVRSRTASTNARTGGSDSADRIGSEDRDSTVDLSAIRAVFAARADDAAPAAEASADEESHGTADAHRDGGVGASDQAVADDSEASEDAEGRNAEPGADAERRSSRRGLRVSRARERVVLSLGAEEDATPAPAEQPAPAPQTSAAVTPTGLGADLAVDDAAEGAAEHRTPDRSAAAPGGDLLATRFAATGWTPSPVPAPTYVDAPVVDRARPEPVVPDASSFHLEPQSKESLAERFAAELGYRPELEDAAREEDAAPARADGPLAHGRTAIGGARTRGVARVDEVLARRRA
ncbi:hypothetical protein [Brevibacterium ihuae]|uniref:hypothetical protein n=1 Tax=Brevibacterium ihuae TaxID=1631743 RepID=UPI000C768B0F|nr:hypothetical protein [Brevibacterium ihuae]